LKKKLARICNPCPYGLLDFKLYFFLDPIATAQLARITNPRQQSFNHYAILPLRRCAVVPLRLS
jgi:hypothetical protein